MSTHNIRFIKNWRNFSQNYQQIPLLNKSSGYTYTIRVIQNSVFEAYAERLRPPFALLQSNQGFLKVSKAFSIWFH